MILNTTAVAHTETKGISDPVFLELAPACVGKDNTLEGIDTVSGATISSKAYMNGIRDAFIAFDIVQGGI
jgi:major membrane immunogen (membrane-anchored lipoprotein)